MNKAIKKIFFVIIGLLAAVVFLSSVGLSVANSEKIALGVNVGGIDVGGLQREEAKSRLGKEVEIFLDKKVSITIDGKNNKEAKFSDMGISIDLDGTVDSAFQIGRDDNPVSGLIDQAKSFLSNKNINFVIISDGQKMEEYLSSFKNYEIQLRDASIYFDDTAIEFKMQPSRDGKVIDRDKLKNNLAVLASRIESGEVGIQLKDVEPSLTDEMANDSLGVANDLLGQYSGLSLEYDNKSIWPVDKKVIGSWIVATMGDDKKSVEVVFDKAKIAEYLVFISQNINEEPRDAVLTYKDGKVQAFTLSRDGRYVNVESSSAKILKALNDQEKKVALDMDRVKAQIDINEIDNLGLTSLLATGSSDFSGSPANRVHNIKVGAAKFNGVLLKPQEEFSFVKILGEVGAAEGYLPELVIKTNQTVPEYGGGICQVSTTAFRAAVYAGLGIMERYPHSFPVKYYAPQGFDAAIYPPSPDLKFVNDTPGNLLIQTKVKGSKLYFELYGTDDGRKVVLTGPEEYDKNPDGSMKTKLTRELFDKDGHLIRTTVYRSNYKSPNLYPVKKNPLE